MPKYEIECYVCGKKFELSKDQSTPRRCPNCQGTFLEMKPIHPERVKPSRLPGDTTEDIHRVGFRDLKI
jgi:DNA-directed RNA polymerase subunit RPC12/RpoP